MAEVVEVAVEVAVEVVGAMAGASEEWAAAFLFSP